MNTLIHLWRDPCADYAILDTPMFPARFYFGPVASMGALTGREGWTPLDNATYRYHHDLTSAIAAAKARGLDTGGILIGQIKGPTSASLLLIVQQLAALRDDAGFAVAVEQLPELGAVVDHADAVLAGKPFDAAGYAGGGGPVPRDLHS